MPTVMLLFTPDELASMSDARLSDLAEKQGLPESDDPAKAILDAQARRLDAWQRGEGDDEPVLHAPELDLLKQPAYVELAPVREAADPVAALGAALANHPGQPPASKWAKGDFDICDVVRELLPHGVRLHVTIYGDDLEPGGDTRVADSLLETLYAWPAR